jgi:hypothetical protein
MCGGYNVADHWFGMNPPKMPDPVRSDPVADRLAAEAESTAKANADRAQRRKSAKAGLLSTGAPAAMPQQSGVAVASALSYGKQQMGS